MPKKVWFKQCFCLLKPRERQFLLEILDLGIPLFLLLLETHPDGASVGRRERAVFEQQSARSCFEDKITQLLLLAFPCNRFISRLSSPLKEAGSVSAKETVLFGAGILWLFRLTHLRAFASSPLARSWSRAPPAAFLFQYKMYLMWKHLGKDDGMGETKVNNVIWETPV